MKIFVTVFLIFCFSFCLQGQENNHVKNEYEQEKKIFDKFFPLAFTVQYQKLYWKNEFNNSIYFEELDRWTPALGIEYSLLQLGDFNFKIGFTVRNMKRKWKYTVYEKDIAANNDLSLTWTDSPYWTYHLPISVEFIKKISNKVSVVVYGGYEFQYYGYTSGSETYPALQLKDPDFQGHNEYYPVIIAKEEELQRSITGGVNIGIGTYLEVGKILTRVNFTYHRHFTGGLISESISAVNLRESPNATSTHSWSGDYISLGVSVYPWRRAKYKSGKN